MDTKALFMSLATEQVNERSARLDQMSAPEIAALMTDVTEDVVTAVRQAQTSLAQVVDAIVPRLKNGGRLIYMGAGTSGRLGVLDASECPPTFGVSPELIQGIIAGGDGALRKAVEGAEDSVTLPVEDLKAKSLCEKDVVVAISASGYAPYCVAALDYAKSVGALAVAMSCNKNANTSAHADIAIEAPTGSEVLSGSTRLKAGTATKLMLNILSTASMVRLGKCYKNLMVDVRATNVKLRDRCVRITMNATGLDRDKAEELYLEAGGSIKTAVVMFETGASKELAESALQECAGYVREAVRALKGEELC